MPDLYLTELPFNEKSDAYTISAADDHMVDGVLRGERFNAGGVTVFSECCASTMSVDAARKVHAAMGLYLAAHDARA
jgi:hypothetical protein